MKLAVIGANGQFGSDIARIARERRFEVIGLTHQDCDVRDRASLDRALSAIGAGDVVVNTAAMHKTDECQLRPAAAVEVNVHGAYHAALAAAARGATPVYISTDYVFDGSKRAPYLESDAPLPLQVYGSSKAAGEALVRLVASHYIVRVSSLFGVAGSSGKGGNFVETMLARGGGGEKPRVVDDIVSSPTSTADAAALFVDLLERKAPFGTYHLANEGAASWREFADEIFAQCGLRVRAEPIKSKDMIGLRRPAYSVLASEKLAELGLSARPWRDGLRDYLKAKGHIKG
ncbi:MAG: dTDP-4-dehydrorhamnose reductase [Candidatus Eremiobacteraeota bacterium]|nr:dTDP-4-dehydrorhamnose reductase [Candidatus Eremiobacteraeota bacterium]MBV8365006.1 dTDP-4-dehydrorhamnose reductase [Candidatus Eremiobacteraeota bacterium]